MYRILSATLVVTALVLAPAASGRTPAEESQTQKKPKRTPDCVYVGTPHDVIDKMLQLASIKRTDLVYDLGCGDGRMVVAAARRHGCRGVGYDINPVRVQESQENIRRHRVGDLVKVEEEDIYTVDLGNVDVILLYLLPSMNKKLIPQLEELKPGARVVTHDYDIEGISPDRSVTMHSLEDGVNHYVYMYTAPLKKEEPQ